MIRDLVLKSRSYRRWHQDEVIEYETIELPRGKPRGINRKNSIERLSKLRGIKPPNGGLKEFVDLARLCSSAANRQALKYIILNDPEKNILIFPYLRIDNNPVEGERASAYIVILEDLRIRMAMACDFGITAQTIMLAAVEKGFGGVMIGAIDKIGLRKALNLPSHFEILLVLALGKIIEDMVIETVGEDGNTQQWWETKDIRHVPKRALEDIIVDYPPET